MSTSSQYPILDNRPIDQWKVTELKEELKRRKLVTKGLKEELIKRLDEALRDEEGATIDMNNGVHESDHDVADEADETTLENTKILVVSCRDDANNKSEQANPGICVEVNKSELVNDQPSISEILSDDVSYVNVDGENAKDVTPHVDIKTSTSDITNQVSEVSISLGFSVNFVSTDSVSVNEKNELKDNNNNNNNITDNVKLESCVKLEMMMQSSSSDMRRENHSADLGSSEKLNLDRSYGDDSMEEDALECKQTDMKLNSEEVSEKGERSEVIDTKEDSFVAINTDSVAEENIIIPENKHVAASSLNKRKISEQAVPSNEPSKRQHRWKTDTNIVKESQISNVPKSIIPKRNLLRSNSIDTDNNVKEREVPPSKKVATNSLRIDRFLRPFTLKAVQDLLSKTGTVTSFWMDNIKTHCYVTFKSVEEAVETRNAIYNLQWPPNGGHNLVADFVNPDEVKLRVEPPPPPPPQPPMSTAPTTKASARPQQNLMHQRLQQPAHPPPPPPLPTLSNPSPLEKVEGPTLTLDDLFKKTKATPRIYYLPLSEERVSAILEQRKGV